jgi:hypothetical protein
MEEEEGVNRERAEADGQEIRPPQMGGMAEDDLDRD